MRLPPQNMYVTLDNEFSVSSTLLTLHISHEFDDQENFLYFFQRCYFSLTWNSIANEGIDGGTHSLPRLNTPALADQGQ